MSVWLGPTQQFAACIRFLDIVLGIAVSILTVACSIYGVQVNQNMSSAHRGVIMSHRKEVNTNKRSADKRAE